MSPNLTRRDLIFATAGGTLVSVLGFFLGSSSSRNSKNGNHKTQFNPSFRVEIFSEDYLAELSEFNANLIRGQGTDKKGNYTGGRLMFYYSSPVIEKIDIQNTDGLKEENIPSTKGYVWLGARPLRTQEYEFVLHKPKDKIETQSLKIDFDSNLSLESLVTDSESKGNVPGIEFLEYEDGVPTTCLITRPNGVIYEIHGPWTVCASSGIPKEQFFDYWLNKEEYKHKSKNGRDAFKAYKTFKGID